MLKPLSWGPVSWLPRLLWYPSLWIQPLVGLDSWPSSLPPHTYYQSLGAGEKGFGLKLTYHTENLPLDQRNRNACHPLVGWCYFSVAIEQITPKLSNLKQKSTSIVSRSFHGSGIWGQFHGAVWPWSLSGACSADVGQDCSHLRRPLTSQVGCSHGWQVGAGRRWEASSQPEQVSSRHGSWLVSDPATVSRAALSLLEVRLPRFCHVLFI